MKIQKQKHKRISEKENPETETLETETKGYQKENLETETKGYQKMKTRKQ